MDKAQAKRRNSIMCTAEEENDFYIGQEFSERTVQYLVFVCLLLNAPATYECISGMDLLRQFHVLPH